MTNKVRIFVYGTLKKNHGNHVILKRAGAKFLGYDTISGPFSMVCFGGFPAVCYDPSVECASVWGEVYEVDDEGLLACDMLEGHPRWYKREKLRTDIHDLRAWIYLQPESAMRDHPLVEYNMWKPSEEMLAFRDKEAMNG